LIPESEKAFDLGPTYEEEQAARAMAERQAEEAVLLRLLEDNLSWQPRRRAEDTGPAEASVEDPETEPAGELESSGPEPAEPAEAELEPVGV
jgi:hypothetical protein